VQSVVAPAAKNLPMGQVLQTPLKEAAPVEYLPAAHCVAHAAAELTPEAVESATEVKPAVRQVVQDVGIAK